MKHQFSTIIDSIYNLKLDDKIELKELLEHNIADTRRTEIEKNFKKSKKEELSNKLEFSKNIDNLKKML